MMLKKLCIVFAYGKVLLRMSLCVAIDLKMSVMSPKGPAAFPFGMRVMIFMKSSVHILVSGAFIGLFLVIVSLFVMLCFFLITF